MFLKVIDFLEKKRKGPCFTEKKFLSTSTTFSVKDVDDKL